MFIELEQKHQSDEWMMKFLMNKKEQMNKELIGYRRRMDI